MSGEQDYTGDYTYELAHEVKAALRIPAPRRPVYDIDLSGVPLDPGPDGAFESDQA